MTPIASVSSPRRDVREIEVQVEGSSDLPRPRWSGGEGRGEGAVAGRKVEVAVKVEVDAWPPSGGGLLAANVRGQEQAREATTAPEETAWSKAGREGAAADQPAHPK